MLILKARLPRWRRVWKFSPGRHYCYWYRPKVYICFVNIEIIDIIYMRCLHIFQHISEHFYCHLHLRHNDSARLCYWPQGSFMMFIPIAATARCNATSAAPLQPCHAIKSRADFDSFSHCYHYCRVGRCALNIYLLRLNFQNSSASA